MKDWTPIILALIAVIGGGGGIWSALTIKATRRKLVADAEAVNANTTTVLGGFAVDVLLKPLRERIAELEQEVDELRRRVRESFRREEELDRLRSQIAEAEAEIGRLRATVAALRATVAGIPPEQPGRPAAGL